MSQRRRQFQCERLDSRIVPTAVAWDGGAGTGNWGDALNWSNDILPAVNDDVTINTATPITFNVTASSPKTLTCTAPFTLPAGSLAIGTGGGSFSNSLMQTGGILTGAGTITLNGGGTWSGGTWFGPGTTTLPAGKSLAISTATGSPELNARTVNISGTATWTGVVANPIKTGDGAFNIKSSGTFNIQVDGSWTFAFGAKGTPVNVEPNGLLRKSVATGTTTILATTTNNGTIQIDTGAVAVTGGGVLFTNFSGSTLTGGKYVLAGSLRIPNANIVTSSADITLIGTGSIFDGGFDALRQLATNSGSLRFQGGATRTSISQLNNRGTFVLDAGTSLTSTSTGYTQSAGSTTVNGKLAMESAIINRGMLTGSGSITSFLTVSGGILSPSNALTIGLGTSLHAGSVFSVDIQGSTPITQYDQIGVTGKVTLGATLNLTSNFNASVGQSFTLIENDGTDAVTGTFAGLPEGAKMTAGNAQYSISYKGGSGNDVVLTADYVTPLPTATIVVDDGTAQRSRVRSFTVTFTLPVTYPNGMASAFTLNRTGPGTPTGAVNLAFAQTGNVVTVTFPGQSLVTAGSLTDGNYTLTLVAANIVGAAGLFDSNVDGVGGDDRVVNTHRLFGDADGDRDVDNADFVVFQSAFGGGDLTIFDADGDGDTDIADFVAFRNAFGTTLP